MTQIELAFYKCVSKLHYFCKIDLVKIKLDVLTSVSIDGFAQHTRILPFSYEKDYDNILA